MKITTKGRYGLRALVDIASGNGVVSIKSIAERQGLSERYLEQLIAPMKKAGIVRSVRGPQGGYQLVKDASEVSVAEILTVLEGSLYPSSCPTHGGAADNGCLPSQCAKCAAKTVWDRIYESVNAVLESITLLELTDKGDI